MKNHGLFLFIVCLLFSFNKASGQAIDTLGALKQVVNEFKDLRNMSCDYIKTAQFPNGSKDKLNGGFSMDSEKKRLYDSCDAYTMLYSEHWFYRADHRKKKVAIINMDKDYNKKLKKATEKDLFQNGAISKFLDSVLLKTTVVKKIRIAGDTVNIVLGFKANQQLKSLEIISNKSTNMLVSYEFNMVIPLEKTAKGIKSVKLKVACSNFKRQPDWHLLNENDFFSYKKGKLELKKYNKYILSTKL